MTATLSDQITEVRTSLTVAPAATPHVTPRIAVRRTPVRKRLFDLAIALPAALVTLPVTIALGALSSMCYRKSPLFTQPRLGRGGKQFKFWKVRTLPRYAPETADKYQLNALDLPKFARVMRFRHLDEFPQLWLVLAGKMSLKATDVLTLLDRA